MQIQNVTFVAVKRLTALAFGIAAATFAAGSAQAQTLGAASDYNIFVLGDHSASNVDVQGKVAVGGNATYTSYTIGTNQSASTTNTVVGGNYTNSNATVTGNVVVGGNLKHVNPSINGNVAAKGSVDFSGGGGTVNGNITYGTTYAEPNYDINGANYTTTKGTTTLPINFAQAATDLTNKSASYTSLAATTSATFQYNQMFVNAASSGVTVVNITADQLNSVTSGFTYNGSANSTLLINVTNPNNLASINFANTGATFNGGIGMANVLFNVSAANLTTINLAGSFYGSLLAPNATVTATSGGFNGQLVAKTVNGGGLELHTTEYGTGSTSTYFKGTINAANNAVPEPGTLALLGMGLPVVVGTLRRRAKKA